MAGLVTQLPRKFSLAEAARLAAEHADASAEELLLWGAEMFGSRLVVASSFGAEDVVLVHMAARISSDIRVFTLDTGRLPQETYDVMERLRERYGTHFEVVYPDPAALRAFVESEGPNAFYRSIDDRRACCAIRKVEPLRRVLGTADAWVTGLRREQAVTRSEIPKIELDLSNSGKLKLNPLATWSEDDVWAFIHAHQIPFNALHSKGYPSIGCAPCTRAVGPGEDVRAGRWWWERPEEKECGLHVAGSEHASATMS